MSEDGTGLGTGKVRVWDLPTRLFHWTLVAGMVAMWATAELDMQDQHAQLGIAMLTLVVFRILWGIVGGRYARFASFVRGPGAVLGYLADLRAHRPTPHPGHNPLGGWSVVALIAAVAVQGSLGLFGTDDIVFEGPLYHLVSDGTAQRLTGWHQRLFNLILLLVAVHLSAIVFYRAVLKKNLVKPMLTGRTEGYPAATDAGPSANLRAVLVLAVAAALVYGGLALFGR